MTTAKDYCIFDLDGTISAPPVEDMYPFLSREEFYDNMIVETVE